LQNSCITTYPTTFVLAPPFKLSAKEHMEDWIYSSSLASSFVYMKSCKIISHYNL
jgi:hypothetical protein